MSARKERNSTSPAPSSASGGRSASPGGDGGGAGNDPFVRELASYEAWKQNLPLLYDCFIHSNLEWPSYACAWGPVLPETPPGATLAPPPAASASFGQPAPPATPTTPSAAAGGAAAAVIPCLTGAALTPRLYPTSYVTQNFYLSRSTDSKLERDKWLGSPNMLLKAEIYYPNQYRTQDINKMLLFDEDQRNPALIIRKKIVHPGEINRIKVVPQYPDLIATHTDSPLVYVWNTNSQPTRRSAINTDPSTPDLTLTGHKESDACNTLYYALDCSKHNPLIISGGSDQKICLWSIEDYCSTLLTTAHVEAKAAAAASALGTSGAASPRGATTPSKKHIERLLSPRLTFSGHTAQVEEVCFHPHHQELLCSVGDDQLLMIWDMRLGGSRAALRLHTTHTDDVNAVHWNTVNDNLLLTGSSDHSVKLIDLRRIAHTDSFTRRYTANPASLRSAHAASTDGGASAVVHTFCGHKGNVTNVQWHSNGEYFASGSDDGDLCVWSIRGIDELRHSYPPSSPAAMSDVATPTPTASSGSSGAVPPRALWDGSLDGHPLHLLFRHAGHRTAVVNFAWNHAVKDGWTMASLSDDSADETLVGGGRLHVWRVTDLLHRDFNITASEFAAQTPAAQQQAAAAAAGSAAAAASSMPAPSSTPPPISPSLVSGSGGGGMTPLSDEGMPAAGSGDPLFAAAEQHSSAMELPSLLPDEIELPAGPAPMQLSDD